MGKKWINKPKLKYIFEKAIAKLISFVITSQHHNNVL